MGRLYVETLIRADVDRVWSRTQDPAMHQRWDARFGAIRYLPGTAPQRFRYSTCGLAGFGVTSGERHRPDGSRVCALRFTSDHPMSPIRSGAGYWRYTPTPDGVRFATGYDYRPGCVAVADVGVRPLLHWLTAWSFDRLRLWLETGVSPERARNRAIAETAVRIGGVLLVASRFGIGAAALVAAVVLTVPPRPGTPAARRTLRRRPDDDTVPVLLRRLVTP